MLFAYVVCAAGCGTYHDLNAASSLTSNKLFRCCQTEEQKCLQNNQNGPKGLKIWKWSSKCSKIDLDRPAASEDQILNFGTSRQHALATQEQMVTFAGRIALRVGPVFLESLSTFAGRMAHRVGPVFHKKNRLHHAHPGTREEQTRGRRMLAP